MECCYKVSLEFELVKVNINIGISMQLQSFASMELFFEPIYV